MVTIPLAKSPGSKLETGDKVLCGLDVVDTSVITSRVVAFRKAHEAFSAAELAVRAATRALYEHRVVITSADADLNVSIEALAIVLPTDGFDRKQPFRGLGSASPGALRNLPFAEGAREALALEKAVLRQMNLSIKTKQAAATMGNAARKLLQILGPLADLEKARTDAIAKRDACAPAWEKAFTSLKIGARAADDEHHSGIFAALFERPAPKKKVTSDWPRPSQRYPDSAPLSAPASA